jgi:phage shock protein A
MGILDRIGTLLRANINDLLDQAEDPEKVLRQLILDMNNQLVQVKTQVAAAIADERKLLERARDAQAQADEWQRKAELAVDRGDDELARAALARKKSFQQLADGFRQQYEEQHQQVETLKDALRKLEAKIQEAEAKKDLLIARSRRARAETEIRRTLGALDTTKATAEFERLEERVRDAEAQAKAYAELETDTVAARFRQIEEEAELEQELAALKAKRAQRPG